MNEMQVAERKVLRGDVIEKLYQNYGTDIRIAILKNYLRIRGFVTEEELRKAIYYLGGEGKRYIHVEVNKLAGDASDESIPIWSRSEDSHRSESLCRP